MNKSKSREISVVNLLFYVLKRWILIVGTVVVFALLLGVYKYNSELSAIQSVGNEKKANAELVNEVLNLEKQYQMQMEYNESSVYMSINPHEAYIGILQFYVNVPEGYSYGEDIANACENHAYSKAWQESALVQMQEEEAFNGIRDLITVEPCEDSSFVVFLCADNEQNLNIMMSELKSELQSYSTKLTTVIGEHSLIIVDEESMVSFEREIFRVQDEHRNRLNTLLTSINTKKNQFTDAEIALYTVLLNGGDLPVENTEHVEKNISTTSVLKYVVLGGVLGGLLSVLGLALNYICSGKINEEDMEEEYIGTRFLGHVLQKKGQIIRNSEYDYVIENIKLYADRQGHTSIGVLSSAKSCEQYIQVIADSLAEKQLQVQVIPNVLKEHEGLKKIATVDAVVLVEKIRTSNYKDVVGEINKCEDVNAKLLGLVSIK